MLWNSNGILFGSYSTSFIESSEIFFTTWASWYSSMETEVNFLFWISKVVTVGEWKTYHTWRWKSVRKKSSFKTFNERKDFFFSSHSDKRIEEKKFRLRKHLSKKIPSIKCICGTCNPIWKKKNDQSICTHWLHWNAI